MEFEVFVEVVDLEEDLLAFEFQLPEIMLSMRIIGGVKVVKVGNGLH
jgi:hypothetical protein